MNKADHDKFAAQLSYLADAGRNLLRAISTALSGGGGTPDLCLTDAKVIHLAGRDFPIPTLTRSRAMELRRTLAKLLSQPVREGEASYAPAESVLDIVYEICPEMAAAREHIESNATDKEVSDALIALLQCVSLTPHIQRIILTAMAGAIYMGKKGA